MNQHSHDFIYNPGIIGRSCVCGVSQFGTRFGLAEYAPKTKKTTRVSDKKVLWSKTGEN